MSVLTEVLKLFKYDPATDGDMTFNIGQCMNDNWDKLDAAILLAIAAAGAYTPEESYAVGDYCTYKGKLHKCSTAIPTGETWTEAHWTTTTVAAELAELSSQLSNLNTLVGGATTPQGALANLGAGVRPNIADNGNLIDAVNQRQFTSTTQSGRILDRWEISSDATINVTYTKGNGLLLQNLGSTGNLFLVQKRERKLEEEKKYTLSVLTDKGLFSDSLSPGESSYPTSGLHFSVVNRPEYGELAIGVLAGGNSFLVKYVKVEDGEGQTLAYQDSTGAWQLLPQPESDYATQLLKCQKYLFDCGNGNASYPAMINGTSGIATIQTPVQMAKTPVLVKKSSGYGVIYVNGSSIAVTNATVDICAGNFITISFQIAQSVVSNCVWRECTFWLDTGM